MKSHGRNPAIAGYGLFMVVDASDVPVVGELPYWGLTLDEVEAALRKITSNQSRSVNPARRPR